MLYVVELEKKISHKKYKQPVTLFKIKIKEVGTATTFIFVSNLKEGPSRNLGQLITYSDFQPVQCLSCFLSALGREAEFYKVCLNPCHTHMYTSSKQTQSHLMMEFSNPESS